MSTQILRVVATAVLGLLTAGILALVNSWISARAGIDETLRNQRLEFYPLLWSATAAVSVWPRTVLTRSTLNELHETLRSWYYTKGGLFLSESAQARYGDVQELIAALLTHDGDPDDPLSDGSYTDLMRTASALRTALTEDLDTRRRKSIWERRRRSRGHASAAQAARERITRAKQPACFLLRSSK
ncbi:hypothetical protein Q2K19_22210 [Micromonospora soli]|uniref:hypothetical protein n=1 Tax=Micromonospora sp. NBRC 110009 TaxID=3061627 RepID=UPI0026722A85|nr:hypothetical protein [Micromonospora sp. NBRC 110009]WKT96889.1 hypothetical protein Q2K19_22210 [Micromonospora sp. NBRC 110009]